MKTAKRMQGGLAMTAAVVATVALLAVAVACHGSGLDVSYNPVTGEHVVTLWWDAEAKECRIRPRENDIPVRVVLPKESRVDP